MKFIYMIVNDFARCDCTKHTYSLWNWNNTVLLNWFATRNTSKPILSGETCQLSMLYDRFRSIVWRILDQMLPGGKNEKSLSATDSKFQINITLPSSINFIIAFLLNDNNIEIHGFFFQTYTSFYDMQIAMIAMRILFGFNDQNRIKSNPWEFSDTSKARIML